MTGEFLVVGRNGDYFYLRYSGSERPEVYEDDREQGGVRYSEMVQRVHWLCNDQMGRRMVLVTSASYARVSGREEVESEPECLDNGDRTDLYDRLEELERRLVSGFERDIRTIILE